MPCGQTGLQEFTVYFEGCYIVYNENKRRTKTKETECEKNELIKNTSHRNYRI